MIIRRKKRIETFYQALLDIRKRAIDEKKKKNIENLVNEMTKLRSKAFNELLKNELIADESFYIFVIIQRSKRRNNGEIAVI
ncbi:MAG: hypothetical protein GXO85_09180 [Chlorobi bacterium]|nr:hypothetical protein [Chlorobiota bacterium]